jgi:wyosine [tRNA(Phe)-imidazoG37] synthetase (radical SAM superfamily)
MPETVNQIAFGPVPSRRLGQSLGINNIPPKICTYSCIYCQLGRTLKIETERKEFYNTEDIVKDVKKKVEKAREKEEHIDYLTFVPDGEPTLDINLGEEIESLKDLDIPIAVITNSSLLREEEVRKDLYKADWISVKIDAIDYKVWEKVDRPHRSFTLYKILDGISKFAKNFSGDLTTESMLIRNVNDTTEEIEKIASFIHGLKPKLSYLAIPTRPPAEEWAKPATEKSLNKAYQIFRENNILTENLVGYEGNAFAFTGNVEEDLLSITSVHPMRTEGVNEYLKKANANWSSIDRLIEENKIAEVEYNEKKFYLRKLAG